jgi:rod shape-determining protein MreD
VFRYEGFFVAVKRIILFIAVILTAVLQNTDGLLPDIFGVRLFPLIPLVISIGMCEGAMSGLLYGAAAGCFWDVCSTAPDGFNGLYLAFAGCLAGLLIRFFMRNKLLTQYCICAVTTVLHGVLYWLFTIYIPLGDNRFSKLFGFYLPGAILTTAVSFIIYYLVRELSRRLCEKDALT